MMDHEKEDGIFWKKPRAEKYEPNVADRKPRMEVGYNVKKPKTAHVKTTYL